MLGPVVTQMMTKAAQAKPAPAVSPGGDPTQVAFADPTAQAELLQRFAETSPGVVDALVAGDSRYTSVAGDDEATIAALRVKRDGLQRDLPGVFRLALTPGERASLDGMKKAALGGVKLGAICGAFLGGVLGAVSFSELGIRAVLGGAAYISVTSAVGLAVFSAAFEAAGEQEKFYQRLTGIVTAILGGASLFHFYDSNFFLGIMGCYPSFLAGFGVSMGVFTGRAALRNLKNRGQLVADISSIDSVLTALEGRIDSPEDILRLFKEHPELLKTYLQGTYADELSSLKGKTEAKLREMATQIATAERDKRDPALEGSANASAKAAITQKIEARITALEEEQAAWEQRRAALEALLAAVPKQVAEIDAVMAASSDLDRLERLAEDYKGTEAGMDGLREQRAELDQRIVSVLDTTAEALTTTFAQAGAAIEVRETVLIGDGQP